MFSSRKKSAKAAQEKHQATSLFGNGSTFNGAVEAANDLRIDGKVIGSVHGKSKVVTGESSIVEGPMKGVNIEVRGHVCGDIEVSDTLILKSTAIVEGDIYAVKVIVEDGAQLNGRCHMGAAMKDSVKQSSEPTLKLHANGADNKIAAVG